MQYNNAKQCNIVNNMNLTKLNLNLTIESKQKIYAKENS